MTEKVFEAQPEGLEPFLPTLKMNRTQISIRQSYGNCTTNNCQPPPKPGTIPSPTSGLAACAIISVQLPLTAQIVAVRYYSTASYPQDDPRCPEVPPGEGIWAYIDPAGERSGNDGYKYVEAMFHNRSENRVRTAALEVDYTD